MQKMTLVVVVKNGNMYINVHNMKKIFHFLLLYISEPVLSSFYLTKEVQSVLLLEFFFSTEGEYF